MQPKKKKRKKCRTGPLVQKLSRISRPQQQNGEPKSGSCHRAPCDCTGLMLRVSLIPPGLRMKQPQPPTPALTVDVSAPQGTLHLGRCQGDAHKQQDVLQALRVHLTMTVEDLKVAAEGWGGRRGGEGRGHFLSLTCIPSAPRTPGRASSISWLGGETSETRRSRLRRRTSSTRSGQGCSGLPSPAPGARPLRAPLQCARNYAKFFTARFSCNSYNRLLRVECLFPCTDGETEAQRLEHQTDLFDSESVP